MPLLARDAVFSINGAQDAGAAAGSNNPAAKSNDLFTSLIGNPPSVGDPAESDDGLRLGLRSMSSPGSGLEKTTAGEFVMVHGALNGQSCRYAPGGLALLAPICGIYPATANDRVDGQRSQRRFSTLRSIRGGAVSKECRRGAYSAARSWEAGESSSMPKYCRAHGIQMP